MDHSRGLGRLLVFGMSYGLMIRKTTNVYNCQVEAWTKKMIISRPLITTKLGRKKRPYEYFSIGMDKKDEVEHSQRLYMTDTSAPESSICKGDGLFLEPFDQIEEELSATLPIFEVIRKVCDYKDNEKIIPNLLLQCPPGAGKTTIVPLAIAHYYNNENPNTPNKDSNYSGNNNDKHVIVVEPRRIATRSAAQRMSTLLGEETVGQKTVSYIIRGESKVVPKNRNNNDGPKITVMTDGILLNKLKQQDPMKFITEEKVHAIIFDEFHERGVTSDTALALCRDIQSMIMADENDDVFRIIVMSATLLGDQEEDSNNNGEINASEKLIQALGGKNNCDIITSSGRQYPVDIVYPTSKRAMIKNNLQQLMNDSKLLIQTMVELVEEAFYKAPNDGDILVFLPGVREIKRFITQYQQQIMSSSTGTSIQILPLYGTLPKVDQDKVIYQNRNDKKNAVRRIIVSSPIAEASITLERVTCVVDSGLRREPRIDVETGLPHLVTVRCSKDSAKQRAGRAGRTQPGICFRLYTQTEFESKFLQHTPPEILNTDLTSTTLTLTEYLGGTSTVNEILEFPSFVDPPPKDALVKSYDMLSYLEAIHIPKKDNLNRQKHQHSEDRYFITSHGNTISNMPTHPRLASCIAKSLSGKDPATLAASVIASAIIDDDTIIRGLRQSNRNNNDLSQQIQQILDAGTASVSGTNVLQYAARIGPVAKEAVVAAINKEFDIIPFIGDALLPGFLDLIAQYKSEASYSGSTYMLSLGRSARLDNVQNSNEYILVLDTSTGDDGKTRIRSYCAVNEESLKEIAVEKDVLFTVPSKGHEVRARRVTQVGNLELASSPLPLPSGDQVSQILMETIRSLGGVYKIFFLGSQSKSTSKKIKELRGRVGLAIKASRENEEDITEEDWPKCFYSIDALDNGVGSFEDEQVLEETIEPWLETASSLKSIDLFDVLQNSLSYSQLSQLDLEFPPNIQSPDGSKIPISYVDCIPMASAKLQQFFGSEATPMVGSLYDSDKQVPVSLSLLSPAGKPLAQTSDLPYFWKEVYPQVRTEMRGRYPKHPWPEDPINATPTKRTKNQEKMYQGNDEGSASDGNKDKRKKKKGKKRKK